MSHGAARSELDIGGARLAVERRGAGAPVLFVHGSASDLRIWEAQVSAVAANGFEAIAYSRRWHRPNARIAPGEDYSMAVHADDMEAMVAALDLGPVHLIAHSYGAVVALAVSSRRPDLFRSLILIEPPAFTLFTSDPPRPAEMLRLLLRRPALAAALVRLGATVIGPAKKAARQGDLDGVFNAFGPGVLGRPAFAALTPEARAVIRDNLLAEEFTGTGFLRLDPAALRGIARPVLLVRGSESPRIFGLIADEIERLLPDVRRLNIAGASHNVQQDRAGPFNAAMMEFLGGLSGRQ